MYGMIKSSRCASVNLQGPHHLFSGLSIHISLACSGRQRSHLSCQVMLMHSWFAIFDLSSDLETRNSTKYEYLFLIPYSLLFLNNEIVLTLLLIGTCLCCPTIQINFEQWENLPVMIWYWVHSAGSITTLPLHWHRPRLTFKWVM